MYSLDIETLIEVLQNLRIQGFLEADLATGEVSEALKRAVVRIELREGRIISAAIRDAQGRILYQENSALKKIRGVVFEWSLTEIHAPASQATIEREEFPSPSSRERTTDPSMKRVPDTGPSSDRLKPFPFHAFPINTQPLNTDQPSSNTISALIPSRYRLLTPENIQVYPRTTRSVYALVNGANSIQRIAHLLSLPANSVYAELLALRRGQFIVFLDDSH